MAKVIMTHHPIFSVFPPVAAVSDGINIFDFLGVATDARYKAGWQTHVIKSGRTFTPNYPGFNEHYFDWILTLEAVASADDTFRMAELGAGWGTWVVRAALAAKRRQSIKAVELAAVEADRTHYRWLREHFEQNGLLPGDHHLIHAAVAREAGKIKFPLLDDPSVDYGASINAVQSGTPHVVIKATTIPEIISRFSGPLDFLHVDMQGAEYETLPYIGDLLDSHVKAIMVGTHVSAEMHHQLAEFFQRLGWTERMNYPHRSHVKTEYGEVSLGDGLLAFRNPRFEAQSNEAISAGTLVGEA